MAGRQDVLYFAPTPPPQGTDVRAVVQWMQVNLDRIADNTVSYTHLTLPTNREV